MKYIIVFLIACLVFIACDAKAATYLFSADMGYMTTSDYAYYCGIVGVASACAFIIGFHI